jgi:hypothetical protein
MSSPIIPIEGPSGPTAVTSTTDSMYTTDTMSTTDSMSTADTMSIAGTMSTTGTGSQRIGAFASELAAGETTLALTASRGGPPPEVRHEIANAARIEEQLRDSGRQLRFEPAADGRTLIEVRDLDGNTVRTLSTAEALEIAAGKPLE